MMEEIEERPLSRYFKLSESQRELIKTRQRERYKSSPERQRRRMYLRAVSKGLIRHPRKISQYSEDSVLEWKGIKCLPIQMAPKGRGGKKLRRKDAVQKKDTAKEAAAR